MCMAMPCKFLVQFCVDGWGCVPSLSFGLRRALLHSVPSALRQAAAGLTSTGDTQTQFWLSLCVVSGSWCAQGLFEPSKHLVRVWGLILNAILPLLQSCYGFSFVLGHGISIFWSGSNILLLMLVQQHVVILEFSQEKMSTRLSTPPPSKLPEY